MKSIKANFQKKSSCSGGKSSYILFAESVKGKKSSLKTVKKNFNLLVDKVDYSPKDKKTLISQLHILSNLIEEVSKQGVISKI